MWYASWMIIFGMVLSGTEVHPLRLSLCEMEYSSSTHTLSVQLKLFLTDVNEALVFDPYSKELAFCEENEADYAERLLLEYLCRFFFVKVNGQEMPLEILGKRLSGTGDNTALWVYFEYVMEESLHSLEVKNAVFTDLFFDQTNLVYAHVDGASKSLMLNKETPLHLLTFKK